MSILWSLNRLLEVTVRFNTLNTTVPVVSVVQNTTVSTIPSKKNSTLVLKSEKKFNYLGTRSHIWAQPSTNWNQYITIGYSCGRDNPKRLQVGFHIRNCLPIGWKAFWKPKKSECQDRWSTRKICFDTKYWDQQNHNVASSKQFGENWRFGIRHRIQVFRHTNNSLPIEWIFGDLCWWRFIFIMLI